MKGVFLITIFAVFSFIYTPTALAESVSSFHTTIRIETNGQVKTYESDKPGTVIIKEKPKVEVKKTLWNEIISFFQRFFR